MSNRPKSSPDLDLRSSLILKLVVERYLVAGQAIGSKTLAEMPGMRLSAATIRSVLADLESLGLLAAPHTSAGRLPTSAGMRHFLERIFVPAPLEADGEVALRRQLSEQLRRGREPGKVAAETLADLSHVAAIVSLPQGNRRVLRQIEFISLQARRVLAVLVFEPGEVENRVFELPDPVSPERLRDAARQITERFGGLHLDAIHRRLVSDLRRSERDVHGTLSALHQVLNDLTETSPKFRIAGDRKLLAHENLTPPERLSEMFAVFDQKQQWLDLFENCLQAGDMRIFLGKDSGLEALEGCGVITVPYAVNGDQVGVVGVVGPMRMNYASTIPLVQATARALGSHLNPNEPSPIE